MNLGFGEHSWRRVSPVCLERIAVLDATMRPDSSSRSFAIPSWCRAALCGLLCMAVTATPVAAADTSAKNSADSSATHPVSRHRAVKHSSSPSKQSSRSKTSHGKTAHGKTTAGKTKGKRKKGQQAIDSTRARQIQEALIRQHYMDGEPSGNWDAATQSALQRYQADQGWQSKTVPDSRALIKLGLGPNHDHLLNPESAMTTAPLAANRKASSKQPSGNPAQNQVPENQVPENQLPQR